jgi:hypothetical protein
MGAASPPSSAASRRIYGDDVRSLIEAQLAAHSGGLLAVLARYRPREAMASWHGTIRAVEEFINLPRFGIDDLRVRARLCSIPLDDRLLSNVESIFRAVQKYCPRSLKLASSGATSRRCYRRQPLPALSRPMAKPSDLGSRSIPWARPSTISNPAAGRNHRKAARARRHYRRQAARASGHQSPPRLLQRSVQNLIELA